MTDDRYSVLFVCMGNICRSPTAEAVFRNVVREQAPELELEIDSAGTHDYHIGEPPDPRSIEAAARRGLDIRHLRARLVDARDFERFDLIIAMDRLNREKLLDEAPRVAHGRIRLFLEFIQDSAFEDVPDPYYGGTTGFEQVLDLVEEASRGLLQYVRRQSRAA
jgi:protein-tyrosine phosphatase